MLKPLKSVLSIAFTCITILCTPQNNSNDLIWEKAVAPGLIYRSELRQNPPLMVHALRVISSSPVVTFSPELAGRTVYEAKGDGRATVSKTASDTNAIATINADFFPYTGDPLGLMVRQNLLVSIPNPRRSIFAWGPTGAQFGFSKFTGSVTSEITENQWTSMGSTKNVLKTELSSTPQMQAYQKRKKVAHSRSFLK